jgi:phosphoribosylamine--glycine ligase
MRVLVIGSGAREHALAWKLSQSSIIKEVFAFPGSTAIATVAKILPGSAGLDLNGLAAYLKEIRDIDFVVVGPEIPLAQGIADNLASVSIPVFGPTKELAQLESAKTFAKQIMKEAGIPTAAYEIARSEDECRKYAQSILRETGQVVLKASGLAAGKGVFVCGTTTQVDEALARLYKTEMREAASEVVVEQFLEGRECSYFVFLGDSEPMRIGFAVDYKRLKDGNEGPNTGGMGGYTPASWLPQDAEEQVVRKVVEPLVETLKKKGHTYRGCLYVGLMWGKSGPQVVEFNIRLGDPEAQILSVADGRDWGILIADQLGLLTNPPSAGARDFKPTVGVVMASPGYPYEKDAPMAFSTEAEIFEAQPGSAIFGSAVEKLGEGNYRALSGRVLTVVCSGRDLDEARNKAYERAEEIRRAWHGCQYRKDIAHNIL